MSNPQDISLWSTIYHDFLLDSSLKEVNLPCSIKTELLKYEPSLNVIPPPKLTLQSTKVVKELLVDSYSGFLKHNQDTARRISESTISPTLNLKYIELPKSPESFILPDSNENSTYNSSIEKNNENSPVLLKPMPRPSFSHFQLDRPLVLTPTNEDDELLDEESRTFYTSPGSSPSPKLQLSDSSNRRASAPEQLKMIQSRDKFNQSQVSTSRQNSTSSSSRGSSIGSLVETLKNGEHVNWRKAVKKFKLRRFSNENLTEEAKEFNKEQIEK
ncbi:hypothetical protein CLIB1423_07S00760 [[Candida] railenensis]|uniref:RGS domain-containing protein n=1 Tax=[Candida] railenensis TaxID=45579 RepID=A0A9P0VXH1_9ASCO|nr:hypothetical protein CLIB1423_07S00760 [[Candida] railenensis]